LPLRGDRLTPSPLQVGQLRSPDRLNAFGLRERGAFRLVALFDRPDHAETSSRDSGNSDSSG
jgi:hypothetical protein